MLQRIRNSRFTDWKVAKIIDAEVDKRAGRIAKGEYFINKQPVCLHYPARCHPAVYGEEYYALIENSRIVVNRHRDEDADGPNIRVFEVTGLGSCLVTDRVTNLSDFFVPDHEFVGFSCVEEAFEKIKFLSENPDQRRSISQAGALRVQQDHTIRKKCEQIDSVIQTAI